jgi:hypothetical protein
VRSCHSRTAAQGVCCESLKACKKPILSGMRIVRRVMTILTVVVAFFLTTAVPAAASEAGGGVPVDVGVQGKVVQLVAAGSRMCALTDAGRVYCWDAARPTPVVPEPDALALVAVGALLIAGGAILLLVTRSSRPERRPGIDRRGVSVVRCNPAGSSYPRSPGRWPGRSPMPSVTLSLPD